MTNEELLVRVRNGLSYEAFKTAWRLKNEESMRGLDKTARKYRFYSRYNDERARRVEASYEMSPDLKTALQALREPQLWLVLTEDWCVDSAFALPVIAEAAATNLLITLRILPRDQHLDVMDRYLTNGGRSIPKLVLFGKDGTEQCSWGPRPKALAELRKAWAEDGSTGSELSKRSLAWYEDGGWRLVEAELLNCLSAVQQAIP